MAVINSHKDKNSNFNSSKKKSVCCFANDKVSSLPLFCRNMRREKKWFERQGQGGEGEEGEDEKWCWPEGEDPVSLLPRKVAVKVCTWPTTRL